MRIPEGVAALGFTRVVGIDVGAAAGAVAVELFRDRLPGEGRLPGLGVRVVEAVGWSRWSDASVLTFIRAQQEAAPGSLLVAVEKPFTERREKKRHLRDVGRAQGLRAGKVLGICLALGIETALVDPVGPDEAQRGWHLLGRPKAKGHDQEHVRDASGIVLQALGRATGEKLWLPGGRLQ